MTAVVIPNRSLFRAQEVCELADVQAYVLHSWESEFPDLGVSKTPSGPRVYRRADVERVLRIKQLVFVDGLTLAGARRRLSDEGLVPSAESVNDGDVAAMMDEATRQELQNVRRGLHWILSVLSGEGVRPEDRVLSDTRAGAVVHKPSKSAVTAKSKAAVKHTPPVPPAKKSRKR